MYIYLLNVYIPTKCIYMFRSRVSKEERSTIRKLKRRRERERREAERELIQARYTRHRETGLVEEHVVPRDRSNSACFKEIRERLINKEEVLREIDREVIFVQNNFFSQFLLQIFRLWE